VFVLTVPALAQVPGGRCRSTRQSSRSSRAVGRPLSSSSSENRPTSARPRNPRLDSAWALRVRAPRRNGGVLPGTSTRPARRRWRRGDTLLDRERGPLRTADSTLISLLAAQPEVAAIVAPPQVMLIADASGTSRSEADSQSRRVRRVEHRSDPSAARLVDLRVRGDGIVIGSIDTGVEYTHPRWSRSTGQPRRRRVRPQLQLV